MPKSKLVKLEREIGSVADHIAGSRNRVRSVGTTHSAIAGFFKAAGRDIAFMIAYARRQIMAAASSLRRLFTAAVHPVPPPYQPKAAAGTKRSVEEKGAKGGTGGPSLLLVSVCFGLLVLCGVIIALLFLQIQGMKDEIARWQQNLSATQAQLRQVEKAARQKTESEAKAAEARAQRGPIILGMDEMKAIRASIKVLPPRPGAQAKIRVGEEVPDVKSAPVPESLTTQIPKLRGARFSIDDNGAIVLFAEGSSRVDAVIEPQ